jgi:hypothetical protein
MPAHMAAPSHGYSQTSWKERQYAGHIGMPSGLFFSLLGFGMYTLLTGIGSKVLALRVS